MVTNNSNDKLIEEMLKDAEGIAEPGTMGKVIHRGNDEVPAPMTAKVESAGYVYIYDTVTHERSVCNRNMLPGALKKKRPDGSLVYTTARPIEQPRRGALKCLLHPDDPNREHYNDLGLATCMKSNLTSPFQVKRHMQKRHPMEFATIEEERIAKEKADDRAFQQAMMAGAVGGKGIATPVIEKTQEKPLKAEKVETVADGLDWDNAEVYVSDKPAKEKKSKRK